MFKLQFDTSNDSFQFGNQSAEIKRILREIINLVEAGDEAGKIFDENGNKIGEWGFD